MKAALNDRRPLGPKGRWNDLNLENENESLGTLIEKVAASSLGVPQSRRHGSDKMIDLSLPSAVAWSSKSSS